MPVIYKCIRFHMSWNNEMMIPCTPCDENPHTCCVIWYKMPYPCYVIWDKMLYFLCVLWNRMSYSCYVILSRMSHTCCVIWYECPLLALWSGIGKHVLCVVELMEFGKCVEITSHSCNLAKEWHKCLRWENSTKM